MMGSMMRRGAITPDSPPPGPPSPSWSLDFSSGTPSGYTLTRASTGTYVDSSGYIASASTDVARLTHNSSGSRLGLLVEPQATNLCLRSQEFDNVTWSLTGLKAFGSGSTANAETAPDNTTTADLITENSTTGLHGILQTAFSNQGNGVAVCMSVYAKKPSTNGRNVIGIALELAFGGYCGKRFDLTTGSAVGADYNTNTTNFTNLNYGVSDAGNGWYRCWVSVTVNSTNTYQMRISPMVSSTTTFSFGVADYAGDNTSGILIWGAQFEKGIQPSSYIPTTTASVTRSADISYLGTVTNFGRPGSFVVEYYKPIEANGHVLVAQDDVGSGGRLGLAYSSGGPRIIYGTTSAGSGTTDSAGLNKVGWAWDGSGAATRSAINGVAWDTSLPTSFDPSTVTSIGLGGNISDPNSLPITVSEQPNVIIRKITFYNSQLSAADLNTLTT